MMKKINLLFLLSILSIFSMAQEKKEFTLEDLIPGGSTFYSMQPQYMYTTWWGNHCLETTVDTCFEINPQSGEKTELFTVAQLNRWLDAKGDSALFRNGLTVTFPDPDRPYVAVTISGGQASDHTNMRKYILLDFKGGKKVWEQEYPADASNLDRSSRSKNLAFTWQKNLYVIQADGTRMPVSTDGSNDLVYGEAVHRNEFGIDKGTFWSPDGKQLAFYRMDQSMVPDYPQVDINTRIASTYSCKYPMAGEAMHKVTIGIFTPATQKTVWLQTGDPTDRYFTNITWSPDNKKIYGIELNRDQNHAHVVRYDATTGQRETVIYEENHPKYVEPQHGLLFLPWDSNKCVYQSQRDGYNHLYLFDLKSPCDTSEQKMSGGGSCREHVKVSPITVGSWVVKEVVGFDVKEKSIIYCSNELHPLQSNLYKVKVTGGKRTLLDDGKGVHNADLSSDGSLLVDMYSSPTIARNIDIIETKNGKKRRLLSSEDPWKDYNVPEITCGSIKAADGKTDLYYRMVKPVNFDPNKKYPAIVYVYGGPHAHMVEASRNYFARGWEIYMAQKGYLMFILDNRGSEFRGLDFENVTFRHLGVEEMKDKMEGVKFLKSLPYVDANRLGVHGWSFGGFMTTNLMTTYPDVFKVGVAGGPVIDWQYYEVMYGERYMDRPQDNPEGYKGSNLRLKAGNLKGKLQIIIGYNDPVCMPQHSLSFLRACIDAGTQPDFFTYPGDEHNMMGTDRIHLHERITQYFEDYLK
ncbi:MAG: S9 family peptidase [Paraprevotella sp.]|nr:S9 family peptidase [Paraprevotella sp.]